MLLQVILVFQELQSDIQGECFPVLGLLAGQCLMKLSGGLLVAG